MPLVQPEKKGGEGLNMDVRMVSGSEIQAEGLLSDPWSDSGRKENKSVLQKKISPLSSIWSSPKSLHF